MAGVKGNHMKWDGGTAIPFFRVREENSSWSQTTGAWEKATLPGAVAVGGGKLPAPGHSMQSGPEK